VTAFTSLEANDIRATFDKEAHEHALGGGHQQATRLVVGLWRDAAELKLRLADFDKSFGINVPRIVAGAGVDEDVLAGINQGINAGFDEHLLGK
jgi:hypothetical protein